MKSSTTNRNWFRRMVILGAVVGVGVFASTAGAVGRPPDVQDVATRMSAQTADVFERYAAAHPYGTGLSVSEATRPPDIQDVATRMSASTPDVFERYAAAHPYGEGLSVSDTVVSRPPDVGDAAAKLYSGTPDVFERYATAHPYGEGLNLNAASVVSRPPDVQDTADLLNAQSSSTIVSRPPDIQDTAQALQSSTGGRSGSGFDWSNWGIGIGSALGLALLLGISFTIGRQHRHNTVQPA